MLHQRTTFILGAILGILLLLLALLPGRALATGDGLSLNTPTSYLSCTPADTVTTSGVPSGWTVRAIVSIFYVQPDGTLQLATSTGWVTMPGNLSLAVPYPPASQWAVTDPATGAQQLFVGVTAQLFNQNGVMKKKMSDKWTVSCIP